MGDHPEHLRTLVGEDDRVAVVIANALDHVPAEARHSRVARELAALADLGFDAVELDLRDYFGQQQRLRHDLDEVCMAWLTGAMSSCSAMRFSAAAETSRSGTCWPR